MTAQVSVKETFTYKNATSGSIESERFATMDENMGLWLYGITLPPEKHASAANVPATTMFAPNGVTQIIINPNPPAKGLTKGQTAAHELIAHFRMLLLSIAGKAKGCGHRTADMKPNPAVEKAANDAESGAKKPIK